MAVKLRWKKYTSGTQSAYLDIIEGPERKYKFLGIKIQKGDKKRKEKKDQAEIIRATYEVELNNNRYGLASDRKLNSSFMKYFDDFLKNYHKASKRKYDATHQKFLDFLNLKNISEKISFRELTIAICTDFKEYLYDPSHGLTGETPYGYFKQFKAVLNKAKREKYLNENPCETIQLNRPKSNLKKQILTEEEIKLLAKTNCTHEDVKRAFLFSCFSGLGEAEIKSLKWSNISNGRLIIDRAKNNESINNKLPHSALKILGTPGSASNKVFNLPSNTTIRKHLQRWVDTAEINKHVSFYCGRHSFAVMLLMKGANLKTVANAMGHSDTTNTIKYLNYVDALKDQAMDNMVEINI